MNKIYQWIGLILLAACCTSCDIVAGAKWEQQGNGKGKQTSNDYYVYGRYYCVEESDPNSTRGSCDLQTNSGISCADAFEQQQKLVESKGDVCKRGNPDIFDNTKRFNGKVEWLQGGPCQGQRP